MPAQILPISVSKFIIHRSSDFVQGKNPTAFFRKGWQFFLCCAIIVDMNTITQQFSIWEAVFYAFLNSFPFTVLAVCAFRSRWRFGKFWTLALLTLVTLIQVMLISTQLCAPLISNSLYDALLPLLYVAFIFLVFRDHIGKLIFSVLVLMNFGNLVNVLSKCIEGQLFPALALLRYHFTYPLIMLPVELILLPTVYLIVFRGICSDDPFEEEDVTSRFMWRYLWIIPAIFYLIWMQHFYASGRPALESALDPVGTVFLLMIDAGSVFIYRLIIQLVRTQRNNRRLMAENHALSLQSVQYENLRARLEETRQARHDLRHHIVLLRHIRDTRDFAALDELLGGYPDLETLEQPLLYCQNEMVNAILSHFGDQARERGIRYTVKLDVPEALFIDKPDLAVLFGALLENAVAAC